MFGPGRDRDVDDHCLHGHYTLGRGKETRKEEGPENPKPIRKESGQFREYLLLKMWADDRLCYSFAGPANVRFPSRRERAFCCPSSLLWILLATRPVSYGKRRCCYEFALARCSCLYINVASGWITLNIRPLYRAVYAGACVIEGYRIHTHTHTEGCRCCVRVCTSPWSD